MTILTPLLGPQCPSPSFAALSGHASSGASDSSSVSHSGSQLVSSARGSALGSNVPPASTSDLIGPMEFSADLDAVFASLDSADSPSPGSDSSDWSCLSLSVPRGRRRAFSRVAEARDVGAAPAPSVIPVPRAPPLSTPVYRPWVDPGAVRPILRFGPALWVAARDLLAELVTEGLPLHRCIDALHSVVSRLMELAVGVQLNRTSLSDSDCRHFQDLMSAIAQTCVASPPMVREQATRALVSGHFLCASYPRLIPGGLRRRLPFFPPEDGSTPSLKRRCFWPE